MKVNITVITGFKDVVQITGTKRISPADLTVEDCNRVSEIEQFLERLTGLRFHITIEEA